MSDQFGRITFFLGAVGSSAWLIYFTGRWYKEWYFSSFGINYEILNFDQLYYMFGSWATVLVTMLFLLTSFNVIMNISLSRNWVGAGLATILLTLSVAVMLIWPFRFDPNFSLPKKVLGSRDLCVMGIGVLAAVQLIVLTVIREAELGRTWAAFASFSSRRPILVFASLYMCASLSLLAAGYTMGNYHGHSAIWEGKMGLRWVRAKGDWRILVVRTTDGRNFLYDRANATSSVVADGDITEYDGPVTKSPKTDPPKAP